MRYREGYGDKGRYGRYSELEGGIGRYRGYREIQGDIGGRYGKLYGGTGYGEI